MSSGIICKIRLEPFLQEFLRGYFRWNNQVFNFPRRDLNVSADDELGISRRFINLLTPPPENFKPVDFGTHTFMIEIPYMQDKEPFYYNYISEVRNNAFEEKIRQMQRFHFRERMAELRNDGYEYKTCVEIYMDELNISQNFYDRLIKDANRWRNKLRVKKFYHKSHLQKLVNCPA